MTIEDKQAIAELVHRYADAVCRQDKEQWASCWTDDAVWALAPGREASGRDGVVEMWVNAMSAFSHALQIVHSGEVLVDGDRATGRWHLSEYLKLADGGAFFSLASYDDEYARSDSGWQFASRTLQGLYRGPADLSGEFVDLG